MGFKAWTALMMVPLAAAFTVSTTPTAAAAGTAPTATTVGAASQAAVGDPRPGVRRPIVRDRVVKRPIVRDRVIVRRPIVRDRVIVRRPIVRDRVIVRRPIVRDRVIVRRPIVRDRVIVRPIVRPIVLRDPFFECAPFLDEDGNFQDVVGEDDDPLFVACAEFFGFDPED